MKRFFFFLLVVPALLSGQTSLSADKLPSGTTRITLPETKYRSGYGSKNFVITKEEDYRALFDDSIQSALPYIDFTHYELLANFYCIQCITSCGSHPRCHRNGCRYQRSWHLIDKTQRIALSARELYVEECSFFPGFKDVIICRDDSCFTDLMGSCSVIKKDSVDFNQQIAIARKIYADCAALIQHEFYLDTVQRCLVWRLYEGYGGCSSMNERSYIFSVPKPPDGYTIRFEEYALPSKR
ncbi:MAG: hypothetical protein M3R17_06450 [Bacteroidota bacterium]|nr:hypothetical protein [Bacteroidota bacterium]